jgi:hypothetical protein
MLIENAGSYSLVRSEDEIEGYVASTSRSQIRCPLTPKFSATELLISRKFAAVSALQRDSVPLMSGFVSMFSSDAVQISIRASVNPGMVEVWQSNSIYLIIIAFKPRHTITI